MEKFDKGFQFYILMFQRLQVIEQFKWNIPDILKENPDWKGDVKGRCSVCLWTTHSGIQSQTMTKHITWTSLPLSGLEIRRESILAKILLNSVARIQVDSCKICYFACKLNSGESKKDSRKLFRKNLNGFTQHFANF